MLKKQSQSLKNQQIARTLLCLHWFGTKSLYDWLFPGFFSSLHITPFECAWLVAVCLVNTPNTLQLKTGGSRSFGGFPLGHRYSCQYISQFSSAAWCFSPLFPGNDASAQRISSSLWVYDICYSCCLLEHLRNTHFLNFSSSDTHLWCEIQLPKHRYLWLYFRYSKAY